MSMPSGGEKLLPRLFASRSKARVLKLFIVNPDEKFRVGDVAVRTKLPVIECRRYVGEFIRLGLIRKTRYAKAAEAKKKASSKKPKK